MIRTSLVIPAALFCLALPGAAQQPQENAALRYWSAFAQMQDSSVTPEQAQKLNRILEGTAPYSDLGHRDLMQRNRRAVETLHRGAALTYCDWGLEYQLGSDAPIEHVPKALALGRLNVLYAFHLLQNGNRDGGIRALAAGLRFSRHVSAGGPLIAAMAAKTLMLTHLRAVDFAAHMQPLTGAEKSLLAVEIARIEPDGVDWAAAVRREFDVLARSGAPASLSDLYAKALQDASQLPSLQRAIDSAPKPLASRIPSPQRVLTQAQELRGKLLQARTLVGS